MNGSFRLSGLRFEIPGHEGDATDEPKDGRKDQRLYGVGMRQIRGQILAGLAGAVR